MFMFKEYGKTRPTNQFYYIQLMGTTV